MRFLLALFLLFVSVSTLVADVIPPGHAGVSHKLQFESSELLQEKILVAAPTAGFGGAVRIVAGEPFTFSSKYGTRFYLVPAGEIFDKFDRDRFAKWPSCLPPVSEIKSVPYYNSVRSALTTLRLKEVTEDGPVIEVVSHEEFNSFGYPVQSGSWMALAILPILGVVICGYLFWVKPKRQAVRKEAIETV